MHGCDSRWHQEGSGLTGSNQRGTGDCEERDQVHRWHDQRQLAPGCESQQSRGQEPDDQKRRRQLPGADRVGMATVHDSFQRPVLVELF